MDIIFKHCVNLQFFINNAKYFYHIIVVFLLFHINLLKWQAQLGEFDIKTYALVEVD